MQFSRRQTEDFLSSWEERDALARAEYLCDQAETVHLEAIADAERIRQEAKAEAAALINRALAAIDQSTVQSQVSLQRQQAHEQAAAQARDEAERLLTSLRQVGANDAADPNSLATIDLRELAQPRI